MYFVLLAPTVRTWMWQTSRVVGTVLGFWKAPQVAVIPYTDQDASRPPGKSAVCGEYAYILWPRPWHVSMLRHGYCFSWYLTNQVHEFSRHSLYRQLLQWLPKWATLWNGDKRTSRKCTTSETVTNREFWPWNKVCTLFRQSFAI